MAFSVAISIVKSDENAKDVVQNAFVSAYKRIKSYRKDSKFSTWLYRIVINEALKTQKRSRNRKNLEGAFSEELDTGMQAPEVTIRLDAETRKNEIQNVLSKMKAKEALVMKLHYLHEMSVADVSTSTGFTLSNVKVLLHRARKNFRILYDQFN